MAAEAKRLELLKAERAVKEGDAATKVQSRVRGRASREEFTALKEIRDMKVAKEKAAAEKQAAKEALSATKVQSHVRRRASREEFEGLKQIRSEQAAKEGAKKAAAATKVQKHARARASREEFFGLKKIRAEQAAKAAAAEAKASAVEPSVLAAKAAVTEANHRRGSMEAVLGSEDAVSLMGELEKLMGADSGEPSAVEPASPPAWSRRQRS